jgi:hypothetical protein
VGALARKAGAGVAHWEVARRPGRRVSIASTVAGISCAAKRRRRSPAGER